MFTTKRIVEFGMCDTAGILFFPRIFELMHSVYEEFILSSDLDNNYFEHEELAIPLVNTSADFYKPITLHEVLKIQTTVINIGNSSFQLKTEFYEEELKATTITKHIFVDKKNFKSIGIPDEFRKLLEENKS